MAEVRLPVPSVWVRSRRSESITLVAIVLSAFVFGWLAAFAPVSGRGELGSFRGVMILLLVVLGSAIATGGARLLAGRKLHGDARLMRLRGRDQQVTFLAEATWYRAGRYIMHVLIALWFIGVWWLADIADAGAAGRRTFIWNMAVSFSPLLSVLFIGILVAHFVVRKRRELGVGMSPEGIYHWRWLRCVFYRWEWLSAVEPIGSSSARLVIGAESDWQDVRTDPEENWLAEYDGARRRLRSVVLDRLACSPTVAYYALCFYLRHPQLREELGDERGPERIRRCDFRDMMQETRNGGRAR